MALETRSNLVAVPFGPHEHETHEIPIILDQKPKGRPRSNSKIYNNIGEALPPISKEEAIQDKKYFERESHIYILALVSLNGTFDRKTLKIPEYPSVLKLGRPTNTQRTPNIYNGYFDSRVISREHAEIYVKNGKLFINDLKSANGTFLNGESIHTEYEIKIGDNFDLGIDISNDNKHQHQQQQHLKISCKIEGFLSFPLDGNIDTKKLLDNVNKDFNNKGLNNSMDEQTPKLSLFDAAMFGDVNNDLEDVELGINHDFLTGIFINNNIGTSSNLLQSIKLLIDQIHLIKLNNMKLATIETFLSDYRSYLNKDKQLLHAKEVNQEKQEIKNLKTEISNLNSNLLKKENEIKQNKLSSILINSKVKELENDKELFKNNSNDLIIEINNLKIELNDKAQQITELNNTNDKKIKDFNAKIENLKSELNQKDELIKSLLKYKQDSINNKIYKDLTKLSIIILMVLIVGFTTLKLF